MVRKFVGLDHSFLKPLLPLAESEVTKIGPQVFSTFDWDQFAKISMPLLVPLLVKMPSLNVIC